MKAGKDKKSDKKTRTEMLELQKKELEGRERQKEKIVEAISKADTIQEAKIVFDTLQETITSSPAEKKMTSLSEAVSRRSTLLVGARNEQKERVANPAFDRLQRLAGIKK